MDELHNDAKVANILHCPLENVEKNLETIYSALANRACLTSEVACGVLGTIGIETASTFQPVCEAFWLDETARAKYYDSTAYGKLDPDTKQRYYGRGFIQRTWKSGYLASGQALKLPLLQQPDLLLRPDCAAADLALFWATKTGLIHACTVHDWYEVRRLVSGGYPEASRLASTCHALFVLSGKPF